MTNDWNGRKRMLGACLTVSMVWMAGCGSATPPQEEVAQPTVEEIAAATLVAPTVRPSVSVNELMVSLVDHAAHVIWNAPVTPPETDEEWTLLEYHAMQLAGASTLISMGGTGEADPGWARLPAWADYAQEMQDAGMAALTAAQSQDVDSLQAIADDLTPTCEGCHLEFKPDLPTEGLVHMPSFEWH